MCKFLIGLPQQLLILLMKLSTKMSFRFLVFFVFYTFAHCITRPSVTFKISYIEDAFQQTFCTNCSRFQCQNNYQKARNSRTNNFTINIFKKYNISKILTEFGMTVANYTFPGMVLKNALMSYFVMYPQMQSPRGVILYYHPTVFGKIDLPTRLQNQILSVAGLYASQGYIVIIPDYVGYSFQDYPHPYVTFPLVNVQSAILVVNEVADNITRLYHNVSKLNLFTVGYSEGGVYSLWTQTCVTTTSCNSSVSELHKLFQLKASIGLDAPYDLRGTTYDFLSQNVEKAGKNPFKIMHQSQTNFAKPGLLAMALRSFSYYYYNPSKTLPQFLNYQFFLMNCTFPLEKKKCYVGDSSTRMSIDDALMNSEAGSFSIAKAIGISALGKKIGSREYLTPNILIAMQEHTNSMQSLVTQYERFTFANLLKSSQVINNKPNKPVFIATLQNDSVVSPINFEKYLQKYRNISHLTSEVIQNTDHQTCQKFEDFQLNGEVDHNGAQLFVNLYALAYVERLN